MPKKKKEDGDLMDPAESPSLDEPEEKDPAVASPNEDEDKDEDEDDADEDDDELGDGAATE